MGEQPFIRASGWWGEMTTGIKVMIIVGIVVVLPGLIWLSIPGDDDPPDNSFPTATITYNGSCESGECEIVFDNAKGDEEIVEVVDALDPGSGFEEVIAVSQYQTYMYSIEVRDGNGGAARCSATLKDDEGILDRETDTSKKGTAYCGLRTGGYEPPIP